MGDQKLWRSQFCCNMISIGNPRKPRRSRIDIGLNQGRGRNHLLPASLSVGTASCLFGGRPSTPAPFTWRSTRTMPEATLPVGSTVATRSPAAMHPQSSPQACHFISRIAQCPVAEQCRLNRRTPTAVGSPPPGEVAKKKSQMPRRNLSKCRRNAGQHSFIQQWRSHYRLRAVAEYDFLSCDSANLVRRMIAGCAGLGARHRDAVGNQNNKARVKKQKMQRRRDGFRVVASGNTARMA